MHLLISSHSACRCPSCGVSTPIKPENCSSLGCFRLEACKLPNRFLDKDDVDRSCEVPVASVYTEFLKWRISRFQTRHVRPWILLIEPILRNNTYKLLGSDVKPCVWAVVEVCLGILGACLPTFPALFHWKSVRKNQRPSGISLSKSADSSQYPVLTTDERRLGFRSGVGNAHKDFLKMIDWADVPKAVEKGKGTRLQEREIFDRVGQ